MQHVPIARVKLHSTGEAPVIAQGRAPRVHLLPDEKQDWTVDGGSGVLSEHGGEDSGTPLFVMTPERKTLYLSIPLRKVKQRFTRVTVHVNCKKRVSVAVALNPEARKNLKMSGYSRSSKAGSRRQAITIDMPARQIGINAPKLLKLSLRSDRAPIELLSIDLLDEPTAASSKLGTEETGLFELHGIAHRVRRLHPGQDHVGEILISEGSRLLIHYALPGTGRRGDATAEFALHLSSPEMSKTEIGRWKLESDKDGSPWEQLDISLAEWAGKKLELHCSVIGSAGPQTMMVLSEPQVYQPRPRPRLVLFITSDTHRADHLGSAGGRFEVHTPNLDALAKRGVIFENCFSSTNVTLPSHAAMLTATHPRDIGIFNNFTSLANEAPTLAERFAEAGYATIAAVSSRHLGDPFSGLGQGFDVMSWPKHSIRDGEKTIEIFKGMLEDHDERPVFAWLHLFDAHTPYIVPEQYAALYGEAGLGGKDLIHNTGREAAGFDEELWVENVRTCYKAEISYLDDRLGRVLDLPRVREGFVALTGDHGELLAEHGIYWDHTGLFRQTVHVPLIMSWPGCPPGVRSTALVRNLDVGRTLLNLVGEGDSQFPGQDLTGALEPETSYKLPARYAIASAAHTASIDMWPWHFTLQLRHHARKKADKGAVTFEEHEVFLYHLERDPDCLVDLCDEEFERASNMRKLLLRWLAQTRATGWNGKVITDAEFIADLNELGYGGDDEAEIGSRYFDPSCDCMRCLPYK